MLEDAFYGFGCEVRHPTTSRSAVDTLTLASLIFFRKSCRQKGSGISPTEFGRLPIFDDPSGPVQARPLGGNGPEKATLPGYLQGNQI